jgi:hypothetical protein
VGWVARDSRLITIRHTLVSSSTLSTSACTYSYFQTAKAGLYSPPTYLLSNIRLHHAAKSLLLPHRCLFTTPPYGDSTHHHIRSRSVISKSLCLITQYQSTLALPTISALVRPDGPRSDRSVARTCGIVRAVFNSTKTLRRFRILRKKEAACLERITKQISGYWQGFIDLCYDSQGTQPIDGGYLHSTTDALSNPLE